MMRRFDEVIQNVISAVWDFTIIDLIRHASNCFSLKTPVRLNIAATCINVILKKSKNWLKLVIRVFKRSLH